VTSERVLINTFPKSYYNIRRHFRCQIKTDKSSENNIS